MLTPQQRFGRYLIKRCIGRGGMAEVYEAEIRADEQISKRLAIKVLRADHRDHQRIISSFIDEARMAAPLSHPNVVEVFDFGEVDGELYMAMEYLDGLDLRRLIQLCVRRGRLLPVAAAAFVSYELALALDYIHNVKPPIVHRDVTPHNVFITRDGHVKLGDFGVAKSALRLVQTDSGEIKGKLSYLAPEQLSGDPVNARTDVYAAGLVLFELLTCRRLLEGSSDVEVLRLAMAPPEILPSSLNPEAAPLDRLVTSALQRHSAMRLPSAAVLASRLQEVLRRMPFDAAAMAELAEELRDRDETAIFVGPHTPGRPVDLIPEDTGAATQTTPFPHQRGPVPDADRTGDTRRLAGEPAGARPGRRSWPWALAVAVVLLAGLAGGVWLLLERGRATSPVARPAAATMPALAGAKEPDADLRPDAPQRLDARAEQGPPDLHADLPPTPAPVADSAVKSAPETSRPTSARHRSRRVKRRRPVRQKPPKPKPLPPINEPAPSPGPAARTEARRLRLQKLVSAAAARGLFSGDSAAYARKLAAARLAISGAAGDEALDALEGQVTSFRMDRRFAERKLVRLEAAIKKAHLTGPERRELSASTRRILKLLMSSHLVEASRLITRQMKALTRKQR